MEPEIQPQQPASPPVQPAPAPDSLALTPDPWETRAVRWIFLGRQGLRSGWSVLAFAVVFFFFIGIFGFIFLKLHLMDLKTDFTPHRALFSELSSFLALMVTASIAALAERRRTLMAYYLRGPRGAFHFLGGLTAGFASLSALVGAMTWGGWLHFGPAAISGAAAARYGALWGAAFLLVGCVEEGQFRCYFQFTLTRGINFWWAAGTVAAVCALVLAVPHNNGAAGVCILALLGLGPCLLLHIKRVPDASFWQAAWVTSTIFGAVHTFNKGEGWVGIFAAAAIGTVFCVSIRLTGTAWWAIGCHAAWDWAQTFFYGTADSGLQPEGHLFTTSPAGNPLWSGGSAGPEGSLLVLGAILFLLALLLVFYGGRQAAGTAAPAAG